MCLTSEIQTPITPLFMNENIKCGYSFSQLERKEQCGTKSIFVFKNVTRRTKRDELGVILRNLFFCRNEKENPRGIRKCIYVGGPGVVLCAKLSEEVGH